MFNFICRFLLQFSLCFIFRSPFSCSHLHTHASFFVFSSFFLIQCLLLSSFRCRFFFVDSISYMLLSLFSVFILFLFFSSSAVYPLTPSPFTIALPLFTASMALFVIRVSVFVSLNFTSPCVSFFYVGEVFITFFAY